jgi:hypothetical protein
MSPENLFVGTHSPDAATERAAGKIRKRVMAEIERLGLRKYLGDVEIDGYTILPPESWDLHLSSRSYADDVLRRKHSRCSTRARRQT